MSELLTKTLLLLFDKSLKIKNWMRGYITYVLPVIMLVIFVIGLISYFK